MSRMPLSDCTHWRGLPESINQMPFDCLLQRILPARTAAMHI